MTTPYTGDDTGALDHDYDLIIDGDAAEAATWRPSLEQLADNIARLNVLKPGLSVVSGGTIERFRFEHPAPIRDPLMGTSPTWVIDGPYSETAAGVATASRQAILMPCRVPHGATLTGVTFYCDPAGAHGGLPSDMPRVLLVRLTPASGAVSTLETATDTSPNLGAYEVFHAVTGSSWQQTIDRETYAYYYRLECEGSTNALVGFKWYHHFKEVFDLNDGVDDTFIDKGAS